MYHYFFSLPKNDMNPGTVWLPTKHHTMLPTIISTYGWNKIHWPKRLDEDFKDLAVKKNDLAVVTMELRGDSGDTGDKTGERWQNSIADMVKWVKIKKFCSPGKIGLFACGAPAVAALSLAPKIDDVKFVIATAPEEYIDLKTPVPTLFLQGTGGKLELGGFKISDEDILRRSDPETKSAHILFKGSDDFIYNVSRQAAGEIVKWVKSIGVI